MIEIFTMKRYNTMKHMKLRLAKLILIGVVIIQTISEIAKAVINLIKGGD